MLARDWYYNERNRMGIEPAVASIYDAHDDADLRARAALKMLGVQRGWRIADIGCGNGVLATEAALMRDVRQPRNRLDRTVRLEFNPYHLADPNWHELEPAVPKGLG